MYVPISDTSNIKNITEQKVNQIPNYEDRSVKFQGKYKVQKSQYEYELKGQESTSVAFDFEGMLPAATYTVNRGKPSQNFVCNFIQVSHNLTQTRTQLNIEDSNGNEGTNLYISGGMNNLGHAWGYQIVPKVYKGETFRLILDNQIDEGTFLAVTLYGWYEDI